LLHQIFAQDRHKHRLDAVDFLDDERLTESDRQLNVSVELGVLVVQNFDILAHLAQVRLEPLAGLRRRVDDQGRLLRVCDHDRVLNRELIRWQALLLPRQHLCLRAQEVPEIVVLDLHRRDPLTDSVLTHSLILAAHVGDVATADE